MNRQAHWETVHRGQAPTDVSWYQPHAATSLAFVRRTNVAPDGAIIDVGGGLSTLVDDLLDAGYSRLTVLDIAAGALDIARARLGDRAGRVSWIVGDILSVDLPADHFAVWHDRAVFHFLTDAGDRARYVEQVRRAVRPGGHVIVATFATDGPERCSGLEVVRYEPETLHAEFGAGFRLTASERELHHTPGGAEQRFIYCYCRVA